MLTIFEELFLLALDEESGRSLPFTKKTLAQGLAGGILAELAFLGKIYINDKHRLEMMNTSLIGDEILDEALNEIQSSEKMRRTSYWVSQLSSRPKKLRERIGDRLAAKELLSKDDRRYYWSMPINEDIAHTVRTKYEMKNHLRAVILSNAVSEPHDLALLNVASATGLLNLIFTQDELTIAHHQIHEKVIRDALKNPVMQTIEEIEQAILACLDEDLE
jgi:golgi phosphoprotein 3